jgi:hypothetical protein
MNDQLQTARAEETQQDAGQSGAPRYSRRLSDKILIAFHQACDQGHYEIANALLLIMERLVKRKSDLGRDDRRQIASLVAAHERLWHLRRPEEETPL